MRVVTFPSKDIAFSRVVERGLAEGHDTSPRVLQAWVRLIYPNAVVRPRELTGEVHPTWYVYRDGRFAPEWSEDWWQDPSTACVALSIRDGTVVEANEALSELVCVPLRELIGDAYLNYVEPEARIGAEVLFTTALTIPELRSLVHLRRGDGTGVTCEFRSLTTGDEIRIWFRPVGVIDAAR